MVTLFGATVMIANQLYLMVFKYEAARLVTGAIKGTSSARLYKELAWVSLSNRRKLHL